MIQKEFKITPEYLEINYDPETGYKIGVYLCVGQTIHQANIHDVRNFSEFGSFESIKQVEEPILYFGSVT